MSATIPAAQLFLVATPIGNVADITQRARDTLATVAAIAAEDTRVTMQLLRALNIAPPQMFSVREHNETQGAQGIIALLQAGKSVAYVSDAGTPGVSDPGARLVNAVRGAGFRIVPVPGASAITTLLCAAGFEDSAFVFEGFVPHQGAQRDAALQRYAQEPRATLVYESTHRIAQCLQRLGELCPTREIVIGKELTKTFEMIVRLPAAQGLAWLNEDPQRSNGEFALALAPSPEIATTPQVAQAQRWLEALSKELPPARAAKVVAKMTGVSRDELYRGLAKDDSTDLE